MQSISRASRRSAAAVELCSTVGGKERVERYEGISSALQTGNVLITELHNISIN
ncbi:MAG: hypothetical protein LH609_16255 [Rudanella sp.]|nr:hypothetical protein [Rudanella sp.]